MRRLASSWLLRLAVTAAVLGYLASRIDLSDAAAAITRIELPSWALIVLALAVDRALAATRWIALVRASGVPLAFGLGLRLFLVSSFLGSFLPAGIGGDIARTWELSARTERTREAVVVAVADRWLGLSSVLIVGAIGLAAWSGPVRPGVGPVLVTLLVLVLCAGALSASADRLVARLVPHTWADHPAWAAVGRLASVMSQLRLRWPSVLVAVVASFVIQAARVILAWLIGSGLGIEAPLAYYFVVMPVGIVLILLPISISGLGPAQGVIIWMLQPLGVPEADAFAMSTLFILLGLVANLPGAVIYLRHRH